MRESELLIQQARRDAIFDLVALRFELVAAHARQFRICKHTERTMRSFVVRLPPFKLSRTTRKSWYATYEVFSARISNSPQTSHSANGAIDRCR